MKINKYEDIRGVVVTEDIVEGRMVLLTSHSESIDFGSREDLPGVKLPDDSTEAGRARYLVTFAVDNTEPPIYEPYPQFTYALRYGFDQNANVPFNAKVRLTQPSMQENQTIPSGALALAFSRGVFTVPSGAFVYSANLVPGAYLEVLNAADDTEAQAGKLNYTASASFAEVVKFNSAEYSLTFRINY